MSGGLGIRDDARGQAAVVTVGRYVGILALVFLSLVPIYWIIATSLKPESMIEQWPPEWIPRPLTFANYVTVFNDLPIVRFFFNSVVIAAAMMVSNVVLCSIAGYTFARKRFWGSNVLFLLIVGSMMVPTAVRLIPDYIITTKLGMLNTYQGIILPTAVTGFGIFMMRQFFMALPREVEDAARIDGCTEWGVLFRVVMPMARPAVTSLALFALVWSVEDVLWPLVVVNDVEMRPLQVGITQYLNNEYTVWGPMSAVTTVAMVPFVLLFVLLQRHFIRGLTAGAVKG